MEKIELECEKISMEWIELITNLQNRYKESISIISESNELQNDTVIEYCDAVDGLIEKSSMLISIHEEISMDMEIVDRLLLQIQSIHSLLDRLFPR
jgi:hypothetical protein